MGELESESCRMSPPCSACEPAGREEGRWVPCPAPWDSPTQTVEQGAAVNNHTEGEKKSQP